MKLWILWLGMLPLVRNEELRWGIMSVFLKPMPLTHSSVSSILYI
ncbi:mCG148380 [Mus musculus]|nr:mCG148380 [Mus musculus]